jgi:mannose-6-phosphate isomerase-like protein (cupin superfamily)
MTIPSASLHSFALSAPEGRTAEPLDILGEQVLVKLAAADVNGAVAIFQQTVHPMSGPPLHRHSREDEWFYVLDGEITLEVDHRRTILYTGGSAFAPRGTAHTFKNFRDRTARILVTVTPGGGFNQFFEKLCELNKGLPAPDLVRTEHLMNEYGIELLGPPLQ